MGEEEAAERAFETARKSWEELIANAPQQPEYCDHLAWFLVNCPILQASDPKTCVEIRSTSNGSNARERSSTRLRSERLTFVTGDNEAAIAALQSADQLASDDDGRIGFYLALAFWENKQPEDASNALKRGIQRMDASRPGNLELQALRREMEKRHQQKSDPL